MLWQGHPLLVASCDQIVGLIVVNLAHLFVHQMAKDIIGRVQYFHMTPEIFLEEDQPPFRPFFLVGFKFIIKNLWICLTEAINRLLDIPHHEAIVAI